jgi:hypothetical protein
MNMANSQYQEQDFEYQFNGDKRGDKEKPSSRQRRMQYSRTSRPVVMHNGIHRRRNKRSAF